MHDQARTIGLQAGEQVRDPGIAIPEKASEVNGFVRGLSDVAGKTNLYARACFYDHVPLVKAFLDRSIPVCHNAHFDIWYLYSEMHKVRQDVLPGGEVPSWGKIDPKFFLDMTPFVICTKMTFASILGLEVTPEYRKETSLDNLCDYLGVDRTFRQPGHRAIVDADLTAECFRRLAVSVELRKHIQVIDTRSIISVPAKAEDVVSPEYDIRHRTLFSGSEWQVYNTRTDEILFRCGSEDEARRTLERHQHSPAAK